MPRSLRALRWMLLLLLCLTVLLGGWPASQGRSTATWTVVQREGEVVLLEDPQHRTWILHLDGADLSPQLQALKDAPEGTRLHGGWIDPAAQAAQRQRILALQRKLLARGT